jgi:hypothetical protein
MDATHSTDPSAAPAERFVALRLLAGVVGIWWINSSLLHNTMSQLFGLDDRVPGMFSVSGFSILLSVLIAIAMVKFYLRTRATTQR